VGTLTAIDEDKVDEHEFSLVAGVADNVDFRIVNNQVQTSKELDFESKSSYKLQIEVEDDDRATFIKSIDIEVVDTNDGPTGITLSENRIDENSPKDEIIGRFSVQEPDAEPSVYSYTFVAGGFHNNDFGLEDNILRSAAVFDYEDENELEVIVRATDIGGNFIQDTFNLQVINVNDVPSDLLLSNNKIAENQNIANVVGNLSTIDQDTADTFTYTLESGLDAEKFVIEGNQLRTGVNFDFEEKVFHTILITTTDTNGASLTKQFTVEIIDDNDAPVDILLKGITVPENRQVGILVGVFEGEDIDAVEELSFNLVDGFGGEDNDKYLIEANRLLTAVTFNFEEQSVHRILVGITDKAGDTFVKPFEIEVLDANDAPMDILLSIEKFDENQEIGAFVAEISTIDVDADENFTYNLVFGDGDKDIGRFRIQNNILLTDDLFNSEVDPEVFIRIRSSDGEAAIERSFILTVTSDNEKPQIEDQTFRLEEASPVGTVVGLVRAFDEDFDQELTYQITYDQPVDDREVTFVIDSISGELTVNNSNQLDYETQPVFNMTVRVADSGVGRLLDSATVTVRLEDIIEQELPANNLISPNDDGKNDVFFVQNVSLYFGYTLVIIDQFGNVVFNMVNYDNSWSGVSDDGRELTTGVYYYRMTSPDSQYIYEGSITLIRD
jgi:gliding motility-associated-like protein